MEELAQANSVFTRYNTAVMAQLAQMTATMNDMKVQLKKLVVAPTNQTRSKRKYYYWICGSNYTHGSKTFSSKKNVSPKMRPTTRRDLVGVRNGANDS